MTCLAPAPHHQCSWKEASLLPPASPPSMLPSQHLCYRGAAQCPFLEALVFFPRPETFMLHLRGLLKNAFEWWWGMTMRGRGGQLHGLWSGWRPLRVPWRPLVPQPEPKPSRDAGLSEPRESTADFCLGICDVRSRERLRSGSGDRGAIPANAIEQVPLPLWASLSLPVQWR